MLFFRANTVTIPFINLKSQYQLNKQPIDDAINRVLSHGQYIMGPEVYELESKLAEYIGVNHALTCSSDTDALPLPLMTLDSKKTDAIFTSPFTFFASADSISLARATPVFVDIDPHTYNIDPKDLDKNIQTAVLLEKLKIYDEEIERRNQVAISYTEKLGNIARTPVVPINQGCSWAQYSVLSNDREHIRISLQNKGIPTAVFYPVPIHLCAAYKSLGYCEGDFPASESVSKKTFSLPMHPYLEEKDIKFISDSVAGTILR